MRHTKGPWKVAPPLGEGDYAVLSESVNAGGNFYVASLPLGSHAEAEGNAHLLAAAPDLLDALKYAVRTNMNARKHTLGASELKKIHDAIAKAEGTKGGDA